MHKEVADQSFWLLIIQKCTSQYFLLDKHMISLVPGLLKLSFKHFQGPSKVANMIPFPIFHGFHEPLYLITFLPNNLGSSYHLKEFLKLVFTAAKLTESVVPGCWAMRIALLLWKPIVYDSEVSSTCVRN